MEVVVSKGLVRSPVRQALADAIAKRDAAKTMVDRIIKAQGMAHEARFAAFQAAERARKALAEAQANASRNLVAKALGEPIAGMDVTEAKRTVEVAEEAYQEARRLQDALEIKIGEARSELAFAEMRLDNAVLDALHVDEALERFVAKFQALSQEYAKALATAKMLLNTMPKHLATATGNAMQVEAQPDGAWLAALEAVKRDADAALPQ